MGNLLSYSGISTKIRAMQSKLTREEQIREILELSSVPQVAAYLKKTPEYSKLWASLDETTSHRGLLEKSLKTSIFHNFSKIYQFANPEQRKFLDLYSRRYEIRVLKEIMTNLFDHRDTDPVDVSPYREFFRRHSRLDIDRLVACTNMEEFINALKGNEFYGPLSRIQNRENALLFDYGMALDLYYFSLIWQDVYKRQHEIIALVGPSGEGKTTMLRLILSLLRAQSGEFQICAGSDHNQKLNMSPSTRKLFSYVPQGNTMFSGTIAENMRNVKPDSTDEEIIEALKRFCS